MAETKNNRSGNKIQNMESFLFEKYEIRNNVISNQYEARKKGSKKAFESISEDALKYELLSAGFTGIREYFEVLMANKVPQFDPLKEYFDNLSSYNPAIDPDYIEELTGFISTDDDEYFKVIFRKILVWICGQTLGKIPFNKYCLTLVGEQNDGKTSFLNFLVPPKLNEYLKTGFDFESKDGKISLIQNFIINLDELSSFDKRDINNKFKSVLAESIVKFRPLYKPKEVPHQRRASFVASTNQYEFLTDETGNVRWFIFVVKKIRHDYGGKNGYSQSVNIDDVWRQVYYLINSGFDFNFTDGEFRKQAVRNVDFLQASDELHYVKRYVLPVEKKDVPGAEFLNTTQIVERLRGITGNYKINSSSIGKALRALGCKQESRRILESPFPVKGYNVIIENPSK